MDTPPAIGDSRQIAMLLLNKLGSRLRKNPKTTALYTQFMEYHLFAHMESIPTDKPPPHAAVYNPHHPVLRDSSSTTKLQVVFNASCRTSNGTSLNDHLLIGPKLQQDLAAILLRWRMFSLVYTANIKKMYRQILNHREDADYQRILWQPQGCAEPQNYRLLIVTYGTASAPYFAMRVLKQLILEEGHRFPKAASVCETQVYVDDVLIGADSPQEIIGARNQLMR